MKLVNVATGRAHPVEKVWPYTLFHGELALERKEQSLKWTLVIAELEAVLLGAPKIEILGTSKGDTRLLEECLFTIKIDGEPALEMAPILKNHPPLQAPTGLHCWFEASENDERRGIFVTNGAVVQAIVLAPKIVPTGVRIRITLEAELYRNSTEAK
jgi:hypothetical protein